MKIQINWNKLKKYFLWLVNQYKKKLSPPVRSQAIKSNKKSLLGQTFYFFVLKGWKVKSPLKGVISKIYEDYTVHITNRKGLQILLGVQIDKKNQSLLNKIFKCQVRENQKVNLNTEIFTIYLENLVISVNVYILWDPETIERIGKLQNDKNCFVEVYYRNPYSRLRLKRCGKY